MVVDCLLLRSDFGDRTLGQIFTGHHFVGYSCEAKDKHVEIGGSPNDAAIPRGYYRLVEDKGAPILLDVPHFGNVPLLWGKVFAAPEGTIFLGETKTTNGVKDGKDVSSKLVKFVMHNAALGHECWMTVR